MDGAPQKIAPLYESLNLIYDPINNVRGRHMIPDPIATGVGSGSEVVWGRVLEWTDDLIDAPQLVEGKIIYFRQHVPLYLAARLPRTVLWVPCSL